MDLPSAVLETVARIDGGIVLDSQSNLLAFGAILQHADLTDVFPESIEGGRTTAAISASRFGNVLKISEDGLISFFSEWQVHLGHIDEKTLMTSSAAWDLRLLAHLSR